MELDPQEVERAKAFWSEENVDEVFSGVCAYVAHLKRVLKKNTATDKALKLLESLDVFSPASTQDSSVFQVVIGSGEPLPADSSPSCSPSAAPCRQRGAAAPLTPEELQYEPHSCCKACLSSLPSMPQCTPAFWAQNPLKVPLLCGFKRLTAVPLMSSRGGVAPDDQGAERPACEDVEDWDVIYKTPCGQSLRNHDDVMRFLLATGGYDILQVDFFTFNSSVRLDPPQSAGPRRPELDLSRGVEPTPVELCTGDGGARPADFRYRKERWPHGCFLSRGPALVYECGPWCGCDRARCQNRLVQRGIRVRLQVFPTDDRGWGVRCRDDLDSGTFVCIYAGVILQRVPSPTEPPSPKLTRTDLPSDDEVEVVTEWLAPPVLEGQSNLLEPTSPPLHVPVIQRPADANATTTTPQDRDKTVLVGGPEPPSPSRGSGERSPAQGKEVQAVNGTEPKSQKSLKRAMKVEDVNFLDASKEGNVSRFLNHSCQPNLFIQNVFNRLPRPRLPRHRLLHQQGREGRHRAHLELLCRHAQETGGACHCGSDGCRGQFSVEENLCELCEVEGEAR
ncbi:Histone-lysine N-methyltransferase SETDB2 [Collichthys lucidus]|uniref:Histone-lysine N-methyltransferase SETDB2 n=1 Tax=Collichthys lucidus TaxID=240159 RepID=A0A4U5TVK4_COLLU|nr:Histone-lysine N-methyltransferase SETDB2 [Collichthys lucidus]